MAGDSWRTAGRSGAQVVEEYPGVPPEYPQSTPRGPPSPAAGKSIEDFSQFIEEAEVRCARVLQSTPTVPEARGALLRCRRKAAPLQRSRVPRRVLAVL